MIDVNLDFSGLEDIARDLQTLSKAAGAVKSPRGCIFVVLIRERETATTP